MFSKLLKLKQYPDAIFSLALLVLVSAISFKNYTPGTFLTGVDNFHIEYNLPLALTRSLNAVWQDFQGVGLVGGLAHASDLPRVLLYFPLSLVLPLSFIRYFYIFFCLYLGPLGVYFLFKHISRNRIGAMGASLFYLFNLATVQTFYMPTEMFTTHFAFLPWLFLYVFKFLDSGRKKDFVVFGALTFFSSPQAMTPTIFLVYLGGLVTILALSICRTIYHSRRVVVPKRALKLVLAVFVINAYWLLPFVYFTVTNSKTVVNSKINQVHSTENFLRSQKYGGLKDVSVLKGVWFDFNDYSIQKGNYPLMEAWTKHLNGGKATYIYYILFGLVIAGLVVSFLKKYRYRYEFGILLFLGVFALINDNTPTGFVFSFFREHIPLFSEALRLPFTKFSTITSLCYSVMVGFFVSCFTTVLTSARRSFVKYIPIISLSLALLYGCYPVFRGYLINPGVRVYVPNDYFDLFAYMRTKDKLTRVMNLPQFKYFNWDYYSWGYRGSGFLWYGMPQPILDRSFDPWSGLNEAYYNELSYAIYSLDPSRFINVVKKYNVAYILHDTNIVHTVDNKVLANDYLGTLLRNHDEFSLERQFGGIYLYRVDIKPVLGTNGDDVLVYPIGNKPYKYSYYDPVFKYTGGYFISEKLGQLSFPFASFYDGDAPEIVHKEFNNTYSISSSLISEDKMTLVLPNFGLKESSVPVFLLGNKLYYKLPLVHAGANEAKVGETEVRISINGPTSINERLIGQDYVSMRTDKDNVIKEYDPYRRLFSLNLTQDFAISDLERCESGEGGSSYAKYNESGEVALTAEGTVACAHAKIVRPVPKDFLLEVGFEYKTLNGGRSQLCIQREGSYSCINRSTPSSYSDGVWSKYREYIPVSDQETYPLWVRLSIDGRASLGEEQSVRYRNIVITAHPVKKEYQYKVADVIQDLNNSYRTVPISTGDKITVIIPDYWGDIAEAMGSDFSVQGGCSLNNEFLRIGSGSIQIHVKEKNCTLSHIFPPAVGKAGLLLDLDYISDPSLNGVELCLANTRTGSCDILQILKGRYYFLPAMMDKVGTSLHVTNTAVGKNEITYTLKKASLSDFPVDWMMAIRLDKKGSSSLETREDTGYLLIRATGGHLDSNIENDASLIGKRFVVSNDQAYDNGWVAWCGIKPCQAEHVLVNNWANGWVFDSTADTGTKKITIIFWPQVLEYLGFVALGFWTFYLIKHQN